MRSVYHPHRAHGNRRLLCLAYSPHVNLLERPWSLNQRKGLPGTRRMRL